MPNIFSIPKDKSEDYIDNNMQNQSSYTIDYDVFPYSKWRHLFVLLATFTAAFGVLYIFYKSITICLIGSAIVSPFSIFINIKSSIKKRRVILRVQFKNLLESLSVSMRAGGNEIIAIKSSLNDLLLLYSEDSDIIVEVNNIINKYERGGFTLRSLFDDFAERSQIDDIKSFATVFSLIEGKSNNITDIIQQTSMTIAEKIEIENEIETMITSSKSENTIMLIMPILIVGAMNFMGGDFMNALYTTRIGSIISTVALIMFVVSYLLARKISDIDV